MTLAVGLLQLSKPCFFTHQQIYHFPSAPHGCHLGCGSLARPSLEELLSEQHTLLPRPASLLQSQRAKQRPCLTICLSDPVSLKLNFRQVHNSEETRLWSPEKELQAFTSSVLEALLSKCRIVIFIMQNQLHIQYGKFLTFLQHYMLPQKSTYFPEKILLLNGLTSPCPSLSYHHKQKRKKKICKIFINSLPTGTVNC